MTKKVKNKGKKKKVNKGTHIFDFLLRSISDVALQVLLANKNNYFQSKIIRRTDNIFKSSRRPDMIHKLCTNL